MPEFYERWTPSTLKQPARSLTNLLEETPYVVVMEGKNVHPPPPLNVEQLLECFASANKHPPVHEQPKCNTQDSTVALASPDATLPPPLVLVTPRHLELLPIKSLFDLPVLPPAALRTSNKVAVLTPRKLNAPPHPKRPLYAQLQQRTPLTEVELPIPPFERAPSLQQDFIKPPWQPQLKPAWNDRLLTGNRTLVKAETNIP